MGLNLGILCIRSGGQFPWNRTCRCQTLQESTNAKVFILCFASSFLFDLSPCMLLHWQAQGNLSEADLLEQCIDSVNLSMRCLLMCNLGGKRNLGCLLGTSSLGSLQTRRLRGKRTCSVTCWIRCLASRWRSNVCFLQLCSFLVITLVSSLLVPTLSFSKKTSPLSLRSHSLSLSKKCCSPSRA